MGFPEYTVRQSEKTKHIRLKVTPKDGLCVVLPAGVDRKIIPGLLKRKKAWISDALQRARETRRFLEPRPAMHLPNVLRLVALGETLQITYCHQDRSPGIRLRIDKGDMIISGSKLERVAVIRKIKEWLRMRVRDNLFPIAQKQADIHHLHVRRMMVKSQRTRWASCSAQKNLALNTKLLFLSPELVRYVLVHELSHTVQMNHSKEFWQLLASFEPRYRFLDQALRGAWKTVPQWVF